MMSDVDENGLDAAVIAGSRSVKSSPDTYRIKKSNGYFKSNFWQSLWEIIHIREINNYEKTKHIPMYDCKR
ncbi:MAG: hypothetical protein WC614_04030 [bacterium]